MAKHVIFYDGECVLCHRAVQYLIDLDAEKLFAFAPLNGKTAADVLTGPNTCYANANSLVLVEDYQSTNREFWIRSKAIFRVYWLLGGAWNALGWLCFVPGNLGDVFYRWAANHRHQFKFKGGSDLGPKDRFLH